MAIPIADTTAIVPATINETSLPVAAVNLDGVSSTWTPPATGIAAWSWTLLDGPTGHGASLAGAATQTPQLQTVDTWGDYLVFLTVQDDAAQWSETNPLLAPDSAFAVIRVQSETLRLIKPAYGERNWRNRLNDWAAALEETRELVDADRKVFTALDPRTVDVEAVGNHSYAWTAWKLAAAYQVNEITLTLRDGGTIAGGGYTVVAYDMTAAQFLGNDFAGATTLGTLVLPAPAVADNRPTHVTLSGLTATVAMGNVIALRITVAPVAALALGQGMTAVVSCRRA